jgi:hypothetical protein
MAVETPTRDKRWLSADELRKVAAVEPESGPAPAPVHRTDEPRSRAPLAFGAVALLLAALVVALVAF